ncbi:MAG: lamin tail domain-containing protein [Candidatus Eisenbacteria bacterium]|nr:lamin tail domain-containing protein [Candidatus Eisenbacteria bacterium]
MPRTPRPARPRGTPLAHALLSLAFALFALGALAPAGARAMLVNQVRPWSGDTGVGDPLLTVIELYNDSTATVNLSGWTLGGVTPADVIALPAWSIPAGAYLNVFFGAGTDDADFSDGVGSWYTGPTSYGLTSYQGEVALYDGVPGTSTIQDFVDWGLAAGSFGFAYSNATAAGMWPGGAFVDLTGLSLLAQIARLPSGYDRDTTTDWSELELPYVVPMTNHHALQLAPRDGTLQDTQPTFTWLTVPDASDYLIEVDDDSLFGSPAISATVAATGYTPGSPLADGGYYWRVTPNGLAGGPYPRAVYQFLLTSTPPGPGPARAQAIYGSAPVPQFLQHKDARLLCIWTLNSGGAQSRPGCTEAAGAQGPWDAAHPATAAHIPGCNHCNKYCTRASIQMVNAKYGGTLLQDEISYRLWSTANPGPEGDLGHDIGAWPSANNAFGWALKGGAVAEKFIGPPDAPIPFDSLSTEVDGGRPVLTVIRPPGWFHTVVFTGYFQLFGFRFIYITDPWPGRTGWYVHSRMPCVRYYMIRPDTVRGRLADPAVATDTDGDGMMDFDEATPRPFQSSRNSADTDRDGVHDKDEVRQYTFHRNYHAAHVNNTLAFADVDGDGTRAENDCDADNDRHFDGGEDINGNGHFDAGETCVLRATSNNLALAANPIVAGCAVGTARPDVTGGKLHAGSVYTVDLIETPCDPPPANAFLGAAGSIFTDGAGDVAGSSFLCYPPGTYRMIVDVLGTGVFDPDCDPIVCFTVDAATATNAVDRIEAGITSDGAELSWWLMDGTAFESFRVHRAVDGGAERLVTPEPIVAAAQTYPAKFAWRDAAIEQGHVYAYRIEAMKGSGSEWFGPAELRTTVVPARLALRGALPNPFQRSTQIAFDLPLGAGQTRVTIFDAAGRRVRALASGALAPAEQRVFWDGRDDAGGDLAAGIYLVRLETRLGARTGRVVKMP